MRCQSAANSKAAIAVQVTSPIVARAVASPRSPRPSPPQTSRCRRQHRPPRPPRTNPSERLSLQIRISELSGDIERVMSRARDLLQGRRPFGDGQGQPSVFHATSLVAQQPACAGVPPGARGLVALCVEANPRRAAYGPLSLSMSSATARGAHRRRLNISPLESAAAHVLRKREQGPATSRCHHASPSWFNREVAASCSGRRVDMSTTARGSFLAPAAFGTSGRCPG